MSYTDEQTAEMVAEYEANPTRETVDTIAARMDKSARSVIAKLSSTGVYQTPQRTTKTGEAIVKKDELVAAISLWLNIDVPTLTKTGKEDLKKLYLAVARVCDVELEE